MSESAPNKSTGVKTTAGVELSWKDNSKDELAFIVQKCGGRSCLNFKNAIGLARQNVTNAMDTGVSSGASFRYRVYAMRAGIGGTGPSNIVTATIP